MRNRLRLALVLTLVLGGVALLVSKLEVANHPAYVHHRSDSWIVLCFAEFAMLVSVTRFPSRLLAVAAGVLGGGALSNLVWALFHHDAVSNSFVLRFGNGGVAFNLADVFALSGIMLMTVASMRLTIKYRHVLPESTVTSRLVRRLALSLRR